MAGELAGLRWQYTGLSVIRAVLHPRAGVVILMHSDIPPPITAVLMLTRCLLLGMTSLRLGEDMCP